MLRALLDDPDDTARRRARALLDWADGHGPKAIARDLGVRPAQVHKLTRAFLQKRLEVFPQPSLERALRGASGATNIPSLLAKYPSNPKHLAHVAALALQLFDATRELHQLGGQWRRVLEAGARLHNLGSQTAEDARHLYRAHDLVLAHNIAGFSPQERDVIACLTLFHRKKVKPEQDGLFVLFEPELQRATLALAAILRVANGLDITNTQTTAIGSITLYPVTEVVVAGADAEENAACANKRADLWRHVLALPLVVRVGTSPRTASRRRSGERHPRLDAVPSPWEGEGVTSPQPSHQREGGRAVGGSERTFKPLTSDDSMRTAARQVISHQFDKLLGFEEAVRAGKDVESVHDMRVACRRLNSAFRLFRTYLAKKNVRKLRPVLEQLRDALGAARNLDVLLAELDAFRARAEPELEHDLEPVRAAWQHERAQAQAALVRLFGSSAYGEWVERMETFLTGSHDDSTPTVAQVVPALVWKRYGVVRGFEAQLSTAALEELHALRIEIKRLRYTLEFFAEAFGEKPMQLIEPLVALQDQLGAIQDAVVGGQALTDFIAAQARAAQHAGETIGSFQGVAAYRAHLQERIHLRRAQLPEHWRVVMSREYRSMLGQVTARL